MTPEVMTVLLICATIVLLGWMWFLTMLTVMVVEKPEQVVKILAAIKERRVRE